ncbi:MAG: LysR family transcriptional regulator [Rhodobacter sp.]|jgi:DNA-binding transcriptional LysR family regulator|nr:LysR family transcriptional regulator [Rhodobacter sp.]
MMRAHRGSVDMRRLRYFVAVCDHGGFSRAAQATGIAQPALTRQIQTLEQELGHALFARNGRNAVPTEVGTFLLRHARTHLDGLDEVIHRLRRAYDATPDPVTLGVCPTIAPMFLVPLQEALQSCAPGLSVIEAYSGDLRTLMQAGRIDLSLSYFPSDATGLHARRLLTERLVLATPRTDCRGPLPLADLRDFRLILPTRVHQLRRIIDDAAARRGITLLPAVELDSLASVKQLLSDARGGFATILPHRSVAAEAAAGELTLCALSDPLMVRDIALIQPAAPPRPLPEGLTAMIEAQADLLRSEMGP